jgi:hypothetical protein
MNHISKVGQFIPAKVVRISCVSGIGVNYTPVVFITFRSGLEGREYFPFRTMLQNDTHGKRWHCF